MAPGYLHHYAEDLIAYLEEKPDMAEHLAAVRKAYQEEFTACKRARCGVLYRAYVSVARIKA